LLKPDVSPTKLELLKVIKICDILNPSFKGIAGDNCYYVFQHLTTPKPL
jgi:hypothetical protein